jgi:hypothetical protein
MPSEVLSATGRVWTINPPTVLLRTDYCNACILKTIRIAFYIASLGFGAPRAFRNQLSSYLPVLTNWMQSPWFLKL